MIRPCRPHRSSARGRRAAHALAAGALVLAGSLGAGAGQAGVARGRLAAGHDAGLGDASLTARYALTVAGFPIGTALLNARLQGGSYHISVAARVGGVLALFSDGRGAATASGSLRADRPHPSGYAMDTVSGTKTQVVRFAMARDAIGDMDVEPPAIPLPDRVPVTDADKRGIMDPLSALLMPMPGSGPVLGPDACRRTLPVFDGAQRFDVPLSYARTEVVGKPGSDTALPGGYAGPVVVCSARYVAIAGHRPDRPYAKFMAENKDLEAWLMPVPGTRVLVPWRIVFGTQTGRMVITAMALGAATDPDLTASIPH